MTFKDLPDEQIRQLVASLSGHVWSTVTSFSAGGAVAATRTQIENHRVPDAARQLLGWRPINVPDAQTAAQEMMSVFDISGANYKAQPQEVLGYPGTNLLGAISFGIQQQPEYYDVFYPVAGGELISVGVTPLQTFTGNSRAAAEMWWSDIRLPLPVIYSQCNRGDALGTAAATQTNGTDQNINNAHKLIEVMGAAWPNGASTAGEELLAEVAHKCTVWTPVQQIDVAVDPTPPGLSTPFNVLTRSYRRWVNLDFLADRATIKSTVTQDKAITVTPSIAFGFRWI